MRANLFWFNDEQWAKIEPLLPTRQPGPKPQKNRRVLSGIMFVLKVGCRWQDCPPEYGPHKTIYNRFNRWSKQGIWEAIFYKLTGSSRCPLASDLPACLAVFHICGSPPADLRGPRFAIRLHRSGSAAKLADSNLPEQHVAR